MIESINALDKYISRALNAVPLSTDLFHFSSIATRHWCLLCSLLSPHWFFEEMFSKTSDICFNMLLSYNPEETGKILTGL